MSEWRPINLSVVMKRTLGITGGIMLLMGVSVFTVFPSDLPSGAFVMIGVWFLIMSLWIASIVDAAFVPAEQWRQAGLDKTTWIVLILSANFVASVAYFGWIRKRFRRPPKPPAE